ncbi:S8 family serine peptidase [Saccharothrix longispora]|uniref:S8 family serine peptidase n=1 Tax=Saccharothrix longispora TaxID=33920 RepID=UPI0028FD68AC|nr:S8 family serine peptidase [Saccharothrix longispora]MDU0289097.1 S8 family serine peptidase [Saccharothrix longispora]
MSRSRTRWGVALAVAGLVAGGTSATAAPAPDTAAPPTTAALPTAPPHTAGAPSGEPPRTVTLVTGDRVVVAGDRLVSVTPGPGREDLVFHRFHRDGRLHVVPRDAARPLAEDRLDLRLFDVTGLVEAGYDDARRDTVPLIVTGTSASGARVTRSLAALGAVAAEAPKSATALPALLADPGVTKVWLDGKREPTLDRSTAQIGAPTAWAAGYTGAGVKVAVVDSGVDQDHPDLVGRQVAERNFTGDPDATDLVGHGTHVAATVASTRAPHRGVAPDAQIIDAKVCSVAACQESWIVDGMTWAVEQGADVLNVSLGGTDGPGLDPLEQAVEALSASSGALFVIAAGNSGRPGTIGSPGSAESALTVGAVDRDDGIAPFSSRGPRVGDGAPKPDVTAPGVGIVAAEADSGGDHVAMSGTSMATPHVAGAAALLAQQHPDWTGARIKAALMATARHNAGLTAFDQGAGRVDLARGITAAVTADPPSLAFGSQPWPHDDDTPVTREVSLRNPGAAPVTLALTADADGSAPAGLFTVTPATVTIPAGGAATATVTADARVAGADGAYSGALVAGGDGAELRVPLGVDREVESYDVRFDFVDADGAPAADYLAFVIGLDADTVSVVTGEPGGTTARLPKGEYLVINEVATGTRRALLPRPSLTVAGDTTVTADARAARPIRVGYPDAGATPRVADLLVVREHRGLLHGIGTAFPGGYGDGTSIAHLGPELPADELGVLTGEQASGTPVDGTPVGYRFAWLHRGKAPTGLVRSPAKRDLAEVRTAFGPVAEGSDLLHGAFPVLPQGINGLIWDADVDTRSIDYATTGDGLRWVFSPYQVRDGAGVAAQYSEPLALRAGRVHRERFNHAVFGPTLPASDRPYLSRAGDVIDFSVPVFGDGEGHTGGAAPASARTTLHRDGVLVGEEPYPGGGTFAVPPGPARFRIDTEVERAPGVSEFTTAVRSSWTFRSDTVPGAESRTLPLTVVRFAPDLDDATGSAPRGRLLRVPLVVEQQAAARVDRLTVEVSFDDGKSWSKVPVAGRTALVRNPGAAGFASLRVSGADRAGNGFEHTLIRAYKIA